MFFALIMKTFSSHRYGNSALMYHDLNREFFMLWEVVFVFNKFFKCAFKSINFILEIFISNNLFYFRKLFELIIFLLELLRHCLD